MQTFNRPTITIDDVDGILASPAPLNVAADSLHSCSTPVYTMWPGRKVKKEAVAQ